MRTFVLRVAMVALSAAFIGGTFTATAHANQATGWVEGRFVADTEILAEPVPGAAVRGYGTSGSSVAVNCKTPDGNWYNVNAHTASGWVWHPNQVTTTNDSLIGVC